VIGRSLLETPKTANVRHNAGTKAPGLDAPVLETMCHPARRLDHVICADTQVSDRRKRPSCSAKGRSVWRLCEIGGVVAQGEDHTLLVAATSRSKAARARSKRIGRLRKRGPLLPSSSLRLSRGWSPCRQKHPASATGGSDRSCRKVDLGRIARTRKARCNDWGWFTRFHPELEEEF